jgi:hypothetical protein
MGGGLEDWFGMDLEKGKFCSLKMTCRAGAEPHYGLGGLGPPQAKGLPQKKKKKNLKKKKKKYNFYSYSLKNL